LEASCAESALGSVEVALDLVESARRGYSENRFEREAQEFSAAAVDRYRDYLNPKGEDKAEGGVGA
jgi:hypothetical protein